MERLSYIDEHAIGVDASCDATWSAVLRVLCRDPYDPSTVPPGFVLDSADPPNRFAMKGRHWFSTYRLVFEVADLVDGADPHRTRLAAQTWAIFPGTLGRLYRALVIGSGAHQVVVRRMLRRVAAAARRLDG